MGTATKIARRPQRKSLLSTQPEHTQPLRIERPAVEPPNLETQKEGAQRDSPAGLSAHSASTPPPRGVPRPVMPIGSRPGPPGQIDALKYREARRGSLPCGPLAAHIEKRPPRARRPALPQPRAAVLSAKAGLTAGFGMGPGDPRLCGRARGGRSPAAHDMEPARSPHRGDPGGRMAGTGEDGASRSVLHRGCEELGLLVPLG